MVLLDHAVNQYLDSITLLQDRVEFPSVSFDRIDDSSVSVHITLALKDCQKENFNEPRQSTSSHSDESRDFSDPPGGLGTIVEQG